MRQSATDSSGRLAIDILSLKTSALLLSLYMNIFQKRAVNPESYIIDFSQSVYRLRSPDISVLSGNTQKSRSAMTVRQENSRLRPQEEQQNTWKIQLGCNNMICPGNTF
jgi:hypothetical protein